MSGHCDGVLLREKDSIKICIMTVKWKYFYDLTAIFIHAVVLSVNSGES